MNVEISNYDVVVTECGWQIEVGIRQEEIKRLRMMVAGKAGLC